MGILIDASVLIENERGRLDPHKHLQEHLGEDAFLSAITASELLFGVHRATDAAIRTRRSAWVEGILSAFPLLPVDIAIARCHAELSAGLETSGLRIGVHDAWLAATCVVHGLTMVTANLREFERVPGLAVESWISEKENPQ